jgi:ribonuclease T1
MVGGSKSKWGLAAAAAAFVLSVAGVSLDAAARPGDGPSGLAERPAVGTVPLAALPVEAQQTERLIRAGGPFPYAKDGIVFGNREQILPRQSRGFYREYTVRTPGSSDRGARRIVCGGVKPREPEACFYTEDHYASFRRIAP